MCLFERYDFLQIFPGVGLLDHVVVLFLVSKEPPCCSPLSGYADYIPTSSIGRFAILTPLQHSLFLDFLVMSILTDVKMMMPHCSFNPWAALFMSSKSI